jgi:hypothetical protein
MRRVLLYGNSLVVSTVGASLQECGGLELVRVDAGAAGSAGGADTAARLSALAPAAVIFDRVTTRPDLVLALLDQLPQALLIGVNPSSDQVLVLSGRQERAVAPEDLLGVIQREARNCEGNGIKGKKGVLYP